MNTRLNIKKLALSTEFTVFIAYILICIAFTLLSPYFLTIKNFANIGIYSAITGVTATGMTLALVSGGFDVSVGSVMALVTMVCATLLQGGTSTFFAIVLGLGTATLCGVFNATMITAVKINPLITTLSTMSIFRGAAYLYTNGTSVIIQNEAFKWIGRGYLFNAVPFTIVLVLISFIIMAYVMKYTSFGRKVYAIGGNVVASRFSGINVRRIRFGVFTLCGFMAGVSGVMLSSQTGAGLPTGAQGLEMDIIAACILGGTSLKGGKGTVWGSLLGILLLGTLNNGMTLMNVQTFWQMIVKGGVLLIAVVIDVVRGGGYE